MGPVRDILSLRRRLAAVYNPSHKLSQHESRRVLRQHDGLGGGAAPLRDPEAQ